MYDSSHELNIVNAIETPPKFNPPVIKNLNPVVSNSYEKAVIKNINQSATSNEKTKPNSKVTFIDEQFNLTDFDIDDDTYTSSKFNPSVNINENSTIKEMSNFLSKKPFKKNNASVASKPYVKKIFKNMYKPKAYRF